MDTERMRISLGVAFVKTKVWIRMLFGAVGFVFVAWGGYRAFEVYQEAREVRAITGTNPHQFEAIFTSAAEPYLLLMGAGIIIVFLASR